MKDPVPPVPRDVLTQSEAASRSSRVSGCSYTIALDLAAGSTTYRGTVTVAFDLSGEGDTFLDFRGKHIERLAVNGTNLEPSWTGYRLTLPEAALQRHNVVQVSYENEYDHQGDGFHQFVDPLDGEEYLYTNFEPYDSHRLFPQFDQPDIKATYELTVTAPREWEVVANSREIACDPASDGRLRHVYARTKPFSTYLFCIVAGPYQVFRGDHRGVPLGLYCRKSMAPFLDTDEVFTITRQGLDFFAGFFDFPYPFDKYDQCFVPEFNSGAMENVGCITHNEVMVHREPPTDNQRRRRAEIILHEMAHMWFGDLVTMKWWNDLWLNESFATYMAYLCMDRATRFDTGWLDFNASEKGWGYRQDELVTTHPIAGVVADTDQTFLNFDGITYAKGASVIKQLVASIGMDGFRAGMQHYFRTHAYGNTTLQQFLEALEIGSGMPLGDWAKDWLETASLNTVEAAWDTDGERVTRLSLRQTAPAEHPTLRSHYLEVALMRAGAGAGAGIEVAALPARIRGETAEVPEAVGEKAPLLVFPNHNDHAWVKVALDERSIAFIRERIDEIQDTLLRQMLWSALFTMVRDALLPATAYLELVRRKIPLETNMSMVDAVLGQASLVLGRFIPDERREIEAHLSFEAARKALVAATPGDCQIIWARNLISAAMGAADLAHCQALADGKVAVPGLTVDQDMRWAIATKSVGYGLPDGPARVAAEAERDPTDRGQRARIQAEVSAPDPGVKAAAWERIHGEGFGSLYLTSSAMAGFHWWPQRRMLEPYAERFFACVADVFRERDNEFAREFARSLFPGQMVEERILRRSEKVLEEIGDSLPTLRRTLLEANDELARAIRCRDLVRTGAKEPR